MTCGGASSAPQLVKPVFRHANIARFLYNDYYRWIINLDNNHTLIFIYFYFVEIEGNKQHKLKPSALVFLETKSGVFQMRRT